jgi:hypothetical protein
MRNYPLDSERLIAGDSLYSLRFLPAVAGAALVILTWGSHADARGFTYPIRLVFRPLPDAFQKLQDHE